MSRVLRLTGKTFSWAFLALGLLMLWNWAGSFIPRNAGAEQPDMGVEILLATNGVHTELILPVDHTLKDWRETFPSITQDYPGRDITHIGVGWGDREVFLENPTWADMTASTVLRIIFVGGPGVVRIDHLSRYEPGPRKRPIQLTSEQYRALVASIEAELAPYPANTTRTVFTGFRPQDRFYEASHAYWLANTCNQWTADRLADAGVETGLWTPFADGVMRWVGLKTDNVAPAPAGA